MRAWFRAIHLLAQGKKGLSNIELGPGWGSTKPPGGFSTS